MDVVYKTEEAVFNYRVAGIWIENGHVLLHKDVNDTNWSLPGGRVVMLEDSKTSLKREFREELDIDVKINKMYWVVENFFEYRGNDVHEIGFYYGVSSDENLFSNKDSFYGAEGEHLIYKWIPLEKLNDVELYPEFLRKALKELPKHTEHLVAKR